MIDGKYLKKAFLNAFLLLGIGYFVVGSVSKIEQYSLGDAIFSGWGCVALLGLIAYAILSVACFHVMSRYFLKKPIRTVHAVEQLGFMLIGKYMPGKLWGIGIRALLCDRYGITTVQSVGFSVFELLVSITSGAMVGVVLSMAIFSPLYALLALISCVALSYQGYIAQIWLLEKILGLKFAKRFGFIPLQLLRVIRFSGYMKCLTAYCMLWGIIALVLNCYMNVFAENINLTSRMILPGYYAGGVILGFLALFSPGGIGVREGVFVVFAGDIVGYSSATSIAMMMRVWSTLYDIAFGLLAAALYFSIKEDESPHG